ncbi:maleylacetoacetate isomerase [Cohaesibacter celericrescens]|uniref:Maleylacetoacetate isomerase n=1 Tax=Cohaesibacter celericrescens TaxID=2067669 RepID=A0A2N5XN89_9HYPH|nr:maleylacetoacetate isomerase [Cohaesibacter celericrescens]PLW75963.1 maleylacetoacetate isomerase [Cohaesibacter celericrescens]
MITLYDYWRSTASYRVRITLGLAGLEWQSIPVDLVAGEQSSDAHLDRNPQGLVPVLDIDGQRFTQSIAIVEYLNETRSLGLLPPDAEGRARVRMLAYMIAMDLHPVCNLRVAKYAVAHSNGGLTMQSWMQAHITPALLALEDMLEGGDFCFGETLSIADICLLPQLYNAHRWGVTLDAMPKIKRIEDNLSTIPAFAAAHPDQIVH